VADELGARYGGHTFLNPALIVDEYDFDRDARVDVFDELIARYDSTWFLTALKLISVPGSSPAAPPAPSATLDSSPSAPTTRSAPASIGDRPAIGPIDTWQSASWITRSPARIRPPAESLPAMGAETGQRIVPTGPPIAPEPAVDIDAGWVKPLDDWLDSGIEPAGRREFPNVEVLIAETLWAYQFDGAPAHSDSEGPQEESAVDEFFLSYDFSWP
jgi:hypothetical protein